MNLDEGDVMRKREEMRELILSTVRDLVQDFLFYDRKEDVELAQGAIENAIDDGDIGINEIVEEFRRALMERLEA